MTDYKNFDLVHQLKRRIRVISPVLKNNPERCYILDILLKKRPEIKRIRLVASIGSVVIEFDAARLPKKNLLILLDAVLGNIASKNTSEIHQKTKNLDGPLTEVDLAIEGMTCASCALLIEMVLKRDPQVKNASVNFATETVTVTGVLDRRAVCDRIAALGYEANSVDTLSQRKNLLLKEQARLKAAKNRFVWAAVLSTPVIGIAMSMSSSRVSRWLQFLLTTPVVFGTGQLFFSKALKLARQKAANMDTLIALGVGSAYGYSLPSLIRGRGHIYFEAAAAIITFVLLGRYLEERARGKAGEAIRKLVDLQPQKATVVREGQEQVISVDELQIDDLMLIRPGEKIPTDGEVVSGVSTVDEAMVTGESMPVVKETGHVVIGGCVNGNGVLQVKVTAIGMDTVLANIVHMVDQAQSSKLPIQKQVDKISAVFVPSVMAISGLTFVGWLLAGAGMATAFGSAVSVLLIACPCALGLATPAAIMVGTGQAAKKGVFIRNGESLEVATRLNAIIFDKTGTITEGKPVVVDFINCSEVSDEQIWMYAGSAEHNSEHFLARAIVAFVKKQQIETVAVDHFLSETGKGIEAIIEGHRIFIGNKAWMETQSISSVALQEQAGMLSEQGKTAVYMALDGKIAALFGIADHPRAEALDAIQNLHRMGIDTWMVTGDSEKTAHYIAAKVGIEKVIANAKPDEKLSVIQDLQSQGLKVGMIGDGINDAPALAAADVGFAIGSGTDIAIESADLTLVKGNIANVSETIELSSNTIKIIRQNLFWAFGYNTVAIPVAALGKLNPMIASAAMALSSVSVIVNSLRLSKK